MVNQEEWMNDFLNQGMRKLLQSVCESEWDLPMGDHDFFLMAPMCLQ